MSDELLRRMEKAVRRFGGPLPIDDMLPDLDAEPDGALSPKGETPEADAAPKPPGS